MTAAATEPGAGDVSNDERIDALTTNLEEGERTVNAVIDGRTEYLNRRLRPEVLDSFVACLLDDLVESAAETVLAEAADLIGVESCVETE